MEYEAENENKPKKELKEIRFKVTKMQHQMIKSQANEIDLNIQDFIRFSLLGFNGLGKVPMLHKLSTEANRVSSNVNQMAREVNSHKFKSNINEAKLDDFITALNAVENEIVSFRSQLVRLSNYDAN